MAYGRIGQVTWFLGHDIVYLIHCNELSMFIRNCKSSDAWAFSIVDKPLGPALGIIKFSNSKQTWTRQSSIKGLSQKEKVFVTQKAYFTQKEVKSIDSSVPWHLATGAVDYYGHE